MLNKSTLDNLFKFDNKGHPSIIPSFLRLIISLIFQLEILGIDDNEVQSLNK
jgi:hypothetical protein